MARANPIANATTLTDPNIAGSFIRQQQKTALSSSSYVSLSDDHPDNLHRSDNIIIKEITHSNNNKKNDDDWIGMILFWLHIGIVLGLSMIYIPIMIREQPYNQIRNNEDLNVENKRNHDDSVTGILPWYLLMSALLAIVLVFITILCFMDSNTFGDASRSSTGKTVLIGSILINIIAVVCYICHAFIDGYISHLFLLYFFWFKHMDIWRHSPSLWSRMSYISKMLESSLTTLFHPSHPVFGTLLFYAYSYLLIQYAWIGLWITLLRSHYYITIYPMNNVTTAVLLLLLIICLFTFSILWTSNVLGTIIRVTTSRVVGELCLPSSFLSSPSHLRVSMMQQQQATASQLVHQTHYKVLRTAFSTICTNFYTCCPGISEDRASGKRWYTALFIGLDGSNVKDSVINRRNFFMSNDTLSDIMNVIIDFDIANIALSIGFLSALFVLVMVQVLEGYLLGGMYLLLPVFLGYTISMAVYGILATTINTILICYYRYPNEFEIHQPQLFGSITDAIRLFPTTANTNGRNDALSPNTELV